MRTYGTGGIGDAALDSVYKIYLERKDFREQVLALISLNGGVDLEKHVGNEDFRRVLGDLGVVNGEGYFTPRGTMIIGEVIERNKK